MNLNDNLIDRVESAANQETESAPLNESASSSVDLGVILPSVPLPTNVSKPTPPPLPEHKRLDTPENPQTGPGPSQTPTPQSSRRPLGSPVRAPIMRALNEFPSVSVFGASNLDEILSPEDKVSEKSSSNPPEASPDTKDDTSRKRKKVDASRKRKKVKLTLENVQYQRDHETRDTYYRNISKRLRDDLKTLGIYTGCYAALYIHRHVIF